MNKKYDIYKDCNGNEICLGDVVKYNETEYIVKKYYNDFIIMRVDDDVIDYDDFPQCTFPAGCDEVEFIGVMNDYCVSLFELACNQQDFEGYFDFQIIGNKESEGD